MNTIELFNKKSHFATRLVGEELILVPLTDRIADMNELFTLNEVGSFIWDNIDGKNNEEDIANAIVDNFEVDIDIARKDVAAFIQKLSEMIANC